MRFRYPFSEFLDFTGIDVQVGIDLSNGAYPKIISGLTLKGDSTDSSVTLRVYQNSSVDIQDLVLEGWIGAAIFAQNNSTIYGLKGTVEV